MKSTRALWTVSLLLLPLGCTSHHGGSSEHRASAQREEGDEDEEGEESEGMEANEQNAVHGEVRESSAPVASTVVGFATEPTGNPPAGWKVEGTNQKGPLATWSIVADATAPGAGNVLALTSTNHDSSGTFNLCWTDKIRFQDGVLEVAMKPVSGKDDQGGGLIWRAKDKDDYYICRANPLESNFRVYHVKNASRHQLGSASVEIETGRWHKIRIEQTGDRMVCSLDGKALLDVRDSTFPDAGGVGLWTKSDAKSEFADLKTNGEKDGAGQR